MLIVWGLLFLLLLGLAMLANELIEAAERTSVCQQARPPKPAPLPAAKLTRHEYNRLVKEARRQHLRGRW